MLLNVYIYLIRLYVNYLGIISSHTIIHLRGNIYQILFLWKLFVNKDTAHN